MPPPSLRAPSLFCLLPCSFSFLLQFSPPSSSLSSLSSSVCPIVPSSQPLHFHPRQAPLNSACQTLVSSPLSSKLERICASRHPLSRILHSPLQQRGKIKRTQISSANGLKSFRFLNGAGNWKPIEKRFNENCNQGRIHRDRFGVVIGMADSKEFAVELFDTLSRRRDIDASNGIDIDEMRKFWEDMTSQDIDRGLQIFFDMCDKNGDGRLSEDEVREVLVLSASANKLKNLKKQASVYASLIMEELDPDHNSYIEINEKASDKVLKVEQKYNKERKPVYDKKE